MPKTIRCLRCNRRGRNLDDWNVELRQGVILYFLCPKCQTPEENAEAEINEATLTYGLDAVGRSIAWPKAGNAS